ncbi:DUF6988 family protein, partial [Marinobacter halodurans]|uniref:DUF6988 family protein n=1 Tax=Marinobacter halodurans TaxID=2528979 RepID=UPI001F60D690
QQLLQHCGFTFFGITWHDMLPCRPDSEKSGEIAYWTTRLTEGDYKAIVQLVNLRLTGSAFALARCVFESYIRGAWLYLCASENELEKYQKDTLRMKGMGLLIEDLERNDDFQSGILSRAKSATWKDLNGFTHSGYQQLSRRFTDNIQSPQYDDREIVLMIKHATALAFLSVHMVAQVAGNSELDGRLDQKARDELGDF